MLRHFPAIGAHGLFPLESACGTLSARLEGIPGMTASAVPADIAGGLEEALGTTNETAVGTSHSRAVGLRPLSSRAVGRGDDPALSGSRAGRVRAFHGRNR
jgi:hypothetical protein